MESVTIIQTEMLSPGTPISGVLIVQLGFLLSAAALLLLAGRTIGRWQTAQENLIEKVDKIEVSNLALRSRCSHIEGVVHMMERREGRPGLWGQDEEETA